MPLIETHNLTRLYKLGGETVTALGGVSVSVDEGDFVAVMGPSGSRTANGAPGPAALHERHRLSR